jgi:hypothetical protein
MLIYEIAYELKLPASYVEHEMTYTELQNWAKFFKKRPIGWRDDQRAYMLLSAQGVKASAENVFPTLRMIKEDEINSQKPDHAIPKGKFLNLIKKAKNGDSSGWNLL